MCSVVPTGLASWKVRVSCVSGSLSMTLGHSTALEYTQITQTQTQMNEVIIELINNEYINEQKTKNEQTNECMIMS